MGVEGTPLDGGGAGDAAELVIHHTEGMVTDPTIGSLGMVGSQRSTFPVGTTSPPLFATQGCGRTAKLYEGGSKGSPGAKDKSGRQWYTRCCMTCDKCVEGDNHDAKCTGPDWDVPAVTILDDKDPGQSAGDEKQDQHPPDSSPDAKGGGQRRPPQDDPDCPEDLAGEWETAADRVRSAGRDDERFGLATGETECTITLCGIPHPTTGSRYPGCNANGSGTRGNESAHNQHIWEWAIWQ